MRWLTAVPLALSAMLPLSAAPAKAETIDTHALIHQAFAAAEGWADRLADRADDFAAAAHDAIIIGGIIVSQNRNAISGGAVGCTLGAATGMGSTVALAVPTGGATIAATPNAMILGCALGAAGGVALGYQLDYPSGR
jgi:hypothetical protein